MRAPLLLRIAAGCSLLFALGHILGGLKSWSPVGETDVLRQMKAFRFDAGGVGRTYLDFYLGFGYFVGAYLLLQAVVLWQLSAISKAHPAEARPLVTSFMTVSIASLVVSWVYIFPVPVAFSAVIACVLALALYASAKP